MFAKHTKNLDQVYHSEFAPLKFQIAQKLKHSRLLPTLGQKSRLIPLFEDSVQSSLAQNLLPENPGKDTRPINETQELQFNSESELLPTGNESEWDFFGTYSVGSEQFKEGNLEGNHQFDVDNLYFDPNQFSIINTITNASSDKRVLLEEFPELKSLINNELGFALQKKRFDPSNGRSTRGKAHAEENGESEGVYLRVNHKRVLPGGTLVGFVPGIYRHRVTHEEDSRVIRRPEKGFFVIDEPLPKPNPRNLDIASLLAELISEK